MGTVVQRNSGVEPDSSSRWQPNRPLLDSLTHFTGGSARSRTRNTRFSFCRADCTEGVAKTKNDWNSRKCRSPATESMSALGNKTPPIGDSTGAGTAAAGTPMRVEALEARFGHNSGVATICVLRSGEALRRNQTLELVVKASWVWFRARP